ncbi:isocitrate lyase/PEP mutase family protein [Aliiroseovarius lamellibrachiae]|uniref:isocitrate lyase/PEP mutase family protein n=1 Tax=Aliiroseovarius lamellibrachiae TaxID=1924933 RepID=UPI001BE032DD|nr:isocitrate lyase/phosphoenolpyruvate mutase family protein [Aliiroseovarius lamellibrachiae]MBT2131972.1 isocitrate lyase/PEP mutase family protein [Aliiroseovarius lamellibrachiae]
MTHDIGRKFRALHQRGNPFILANAWDAGSAKVLASMGAEAIATSSAAHAFTLGRPDMGHVSRDEALAHAQDLVTAVNVPVSGDFENGFGDDPDCCAETVRLAAEVGLAGISIEDTALPSATPYNRALAIERIKAAASAARALPNDFVLLARADGVMNGHYNLDEAMARIKGYEDARADALYVPLPGTLEDQARICAATCLPVNALAAGPFTNITRDQFAKAGVARISLGSALARATHRVLHDAAQAMFDEGDFSVLGQSISGAKIDALLG